MNQNTVYDAIVVGTGISGGWAAKELCENGLKTLVLERGPMVKHIEDYKTMNDDPWDMPFKGTLSKSDEEKYHKQRRVSWAPTDDVKHFFVNDLEHPYEETKRFDWIRGYHVGGRSLTWGRQSYRWSDIDFEANLKEDIGVDWPVRYKDIAPWYDKVESYIGVSGQNLGLKQLPDGQFQPPMDLNCVEKDLQEAMTKKFDDGRLLTIGRVAHITENTTEFKGRGPCQYRNRCWRGCPFGGYFSSNSSTLPAAERTGNMTLRANSIVHEILYDESTKKAAGVKIVDAETGDTIKFKSKLVFLCASAMASVGILLQSKSATFPNGIGNNYDELGRNIMDHHYNLGATAKVDGHLDKYYKGRRPNGFYIPRFVNIDEKTKRNDFLRGFGYQGAASRNDWSQMVAEMGYGKAYKEAILKPGTWEIGMTGFGEMLPHHDNRVTLSMDKKDKWGLPQLDFDVELKANELKMREAIFEESVNILKSAGFKNVNTWERPYGPGLGIHEMGGARMGWNPRTSVVNKHNQVHDVPNVYVTDGAFMTSASCVNPSLTYMAFTARAANHAAEQFKLGKFA
ncbi:MULTISPECIES: GMC family oxidoreductase [Croceitalea]|uniref:GMC family oxidoreductase n=1 Tax=Croceitalea vernalis TaxID=3075599 RepID=A0ABU3BEY9_9FLAO|nr:MULTISPECIES: GMC family oxidoreductase [unclassified Croceitalea]MDT0538906.1 GMC family oxidoreductase [Croceitalea sp. P059]MDT0620693.1 GMC family oxidoreductase [Croceitalea sp. P007]